MLPFTEKIIEETETYILVQRTFMSNLIEEELNWHMDEEDREVFVVEGDGWYLQIENEIPQMMQKESLFKIPKEIWHRIINKNGTNLIINVRKYK
jgi:TPP-dependent trihydroxycyclohexane-1,2-dione (THcHDO) dehydratase